MQQPPPPPQQQQGFPQNPSAPYHGSPSNTSVPPPSLQPGNYNYQQASVPGQYQYANPAQYPYSNNPSLQHQAPYNAQQISNSWNSQGPAPSALPSSNAQAAVSSYNPNTYGPMPGAQGHGQATSPTQLQPGASGAAAPGYRPGVDNNVSRRYSTIPAVFQQQYQASNSQPPWGQSQAQYSPSQAASAVKPALPPRPPSVTYSNETQSPMQRPQSVYQTQNQTQPHFTTNPSHQGFHPSYNSQGEQQPQPFFQNQGPPVPPHPPQLGYQGRPSFQGQPGQPGHSDLQGQSGQPGHEGQQVLPGHQTLQAQQPHPVYSQQPPAQIYDLQQPNPNPLQSQSHPNTNPAHPSTQSPATGYSSQSPQAQTYAENHQQSNQQYHQPNVHPPPAPVGPSPVLGGYQQTNINPQQGVFIPPPPTNVPGWSQQQHAPLAISHGKRITYTPPNTQVQFQSVAAVANVSQPPTSAPTLEQSQPLAQQYPGQPGVQAWSRQAAGWQPAFHGNPPNAQQSQIYHSNSVTQQPQVWNQDVNAVHQQSSSAPVQQPAGINHMQNQFNSNHPPNQYSDGQIHYSNQVPQPNPNMMSLNQAYTPDRSDSLRAQPSGPKETEIHQGIEVVSVTGSILTPKPTSAVLGASAFGPGANWEHFGDETVDDTEMYGARNDESLPHVEAKATELPSQHSPPHPESEYRNETENLPIQDSELWPTPPKPAPVKPYVNATSNVSTYRNATPPPNVYQGQYIPTPPPVTASIYSSPGKPLDTEPKNAHKGPNIGVEQLKKHSADSNQSTNIETPLNIPSQDVNQDLKVHPIISPPIDAVSPRLLEEKIGGLVSPAVPHSSNQPIIMDGGGWPDAPQTQNAPISDQSISEPPKITEPPTLEKPTQISQNDATDHGKSLDLWYQESLSRYTLMLHQESQAKSDEERTQIFTEFVMAESRLRGVRYGAGIGPRIDDHLDTLSFGSKAPSEAEPTKQPTNTKEVLPSTSSINLPTEPEPNNVPIKNVEYPIPPPSAYASVGVEASNVANISSNGAVSAAIYLENIPTPNNEGPSSNSSTQEYFNLEPMNHHAEKATGAPSVLTAQNSTNAVVPIAIAESQPLINSNQEKAGPAHRPCSAQDNLVRETQHFESHRTSGQEPAFPKPLGGSGEGPFETMQQLESVPQIANQPVIQDIAPDQPFIKHHSTDDDFHTFNASLKENKPGPYVQPESRIPAIEEPTYRPFRYGANNSHNAKVDSPQARKSPELPPASQRFKLPVIPTADQSGKTVYRAFSPTRRQSLDSKSPRELYNGVEARAESLNSQIGAGAEALAFKQPLEEASNQSRRSSRVISPSETQIPLEKPLEIRKAVRTTTPSRGIDAQLRSILPSKVGNKKKNTSYVDGLKSAIESFPDDFTFIDDMLAHWELQSKASRAKYEKERRARQEEQEEHTDHLFQENQIGYGDIKTLEDDFKRAESKKKAEEDTEEYTNFVEQVFEPSYNRLQVDIQKLMDHYVNCIDTMRGTPSGKEALEESNDRPELAQVMKLFVSLHEKVEIRHERVFEAVQDRDKRFKKTVIQPLYSAGNISKMKQMEKHFDISEIRATLEAAKQREERMRQFLRAVEDITQRALGKELGFMEQITREVHKIFDAFNHPRGGEGVAHASVVYDELAWAKEILLGISSTSESLHQSFHTAILRFRISVHDVEVSAAKLDNADAETLKRLEEKMKTEEQQLMRESEHRISVVREDLRIASEKLEVILPRLKRMMETSPKQPEAGAKGDVGAGTGPRGTGAGSEGARAASAGAGTDTERDERLQKALESAKRRRSMFPRFG